MALGVVRVHGVGVVGRDARRARRARRGASARSPPVRQRDAFEHVLEQRAGGTGGALAADLLVVEQRDHGGASTVGAGARTARRPRPSTTPGCRAGRWRAGSRRRPSTAAGVRSNRHRSQPRDRRRRRRRPARRATRGTRPSRGAPVPQTGVRCCCLSSTSPRSLTSRSRWIASCGTRQIGASTATSAIEPSREHDPAGDAEVAVEPRVQQHAAVDLDAELLPAEAAGVGARLDPQARRVGVRADDPERRAPACGRSARRQATSAPPRTTNPAVGSVVPRRRSSDSGSKPAAISRSRR